MDIEERIKAAITRITSGQCSMRVPAEETDPDLVLDDCLRGNPVAAGRHE